MANAAGDPVARYKAPTRWTRESTPPAGTDPPGACQSMRRDLTTFGRKDGWAIVPQLGVRNFTSFVSFGFKTTFWLLES